MSMERIGRYEIAGELGRGAMGVVYKATDPNIGRTVALKTMRMDVHGAESADLIRRFQNEARAAGLLNHPNIVTIYDAGEEDGIFYIAMEFLEGITLQELLADGHVLESAEAVRVAREICKGLDYAHNHGIVHRDVKPANVMITRSGAVKIMDFGIAKAGGSLTGTGQVLGTPNYMSPEQVKGKTLDGRSDLFSVGVILYEMLTGEKPFAGQNVTTIIYKIINENPIPPRELESTVSAGLSALVLKTLAKSPDERYQSGHELTRDLSQYRLPVAQAAAPTSSYSASAAAGAEKTVALSMANETDTVHVDEAMSRVHETDLLDLETAQPARSRRFGWIGAIAAVLMLGSMAAAFAYYRTRVHADIPKPQTVARQQPAVRPTPVPPPATPSSTPTPELAAATPEASVKPVDSATPEEKATITPKKLATPPPPLWSELTIDSHPSGAKVSIDGKNDLNWLTPFKASHLTPGTHKLAFSKDGYSQETRAIDSVAGKSVSLSMDLTAIFNASISSNPSGAAIFVDGDDSGSVTPAQLTLEKRLHHIIVRKAGYRDASIDASQAISFSPILLSANQSSEPAPPTNMLRRFLGTDAVPEGMGMIHVRTVPDGATIVIDGRTNAKKSNARLPFNPGIYSVVLRMPGYKSVHRNIKVESGKIGNIDEILERE